MPEPLRAGELVFRGIPVSAGVCHGKILVLGKCARPVPAHELADSEVPQEIQRLQQALARTRQQILEVQQKVTEEMGTKDASIFEAHLLVLEDPTLLDAVTRKITDEKVNVAQAFRNVAEKYAA